METESVLHSETSCKSNTMFSHSRYGINPITFCEYNISDELLGYLQQDALFTSPNESSQLKNCGYVAAVDYIQKTEHTYYEAYFHSIPESGPISSMHPRFGTIYDKQPAPLRLVAFFESIRRKNEDWFRLLRDKMLAIPGPAAAAFAQIVAENRVFGDLAVQLHFGEAITKDMARFHVDGPNSLLHMGVSIRGHRILQWKGSLNPITDRDEQSVMEVPQFPGSVYLSYPVAFEHSPLYPECSYNDRITAIMARCLLTMKDLEKFAEASVADVSAVIREIHIALGNGYSVEDGRTEQQRIVFTMPKLQDVIEVESTLRLEQEMRREDKSSRRCAAAPGSEPQTKEFQKRAD